MKEVLLNFVGDNGLNPFNSLKTSVRRGGESIFKTTDAKLIFNKVLSKLSSKFVFSETSNLWNVFSFVSDFSEIMKRQDFFKSISIKGMEDGGFLEELARPRQDWSPEYDVVVVTEDESTFSRLQKLNCTVQYIVNENDVMELQRYDVVQIIDCEMFGSVLSSLPQSVFISSEEDVYLERFLEELSSWRSNLDVLKKSNFSGEIMEITNFLMSLCDLIDKKANKGLTIEGAEKVLESINEEINEKVSKMMVSGDSLVKILSEGKMPEDFEKIIDEALGISGLPHEIFSFKIPVELDYKELEGYIQRQNANEFTDLAEGIKRRSAELRQIPKKLERLRMLLIFEDFCLGVSKYLSGRETYQILSENIHFENIKNFFLDKPQPISFQLDSFSKCSILTGANSGGKTTLLEHVLQNISFFQLGLPVSGVVHMPVIDNVYYFAKNKGSASKGAFETLLTQMSKIDAQMGKNSLILADEIEAVTEPGVAGKIIAATAEYYISKDCFLIVATHLGYEIQDCLPRGARIDGIEAKGLDADFNLIVDHNPVLGRLAHSTPELIVERMANSFDVPYFRFLQESLKKKEL
jgi:DNA mismatch repair protein MutS2